MSKQTPEQRQRMVEEISIWREPALELMKLTHDNCVSFAQMTIKSGMILNGGAIVALPAISSMFVTIGGIKQIAAPLADATILYVIGLATAWLAAVMGYFAACINNRSCNSAFTKTHWEQYRLHELIAEDIYKEKLHPLDLLLARDSSSYQLLRYLGILFCFISFSAFGSGSFVSGCAFGQITGLWSNTDTMSPHNQHQLTPNIYIE